MPDISMCVNNKCPLRDRCYRFTAKPNPHRQSYSSFTFEYAMPGIPMCEYFINKKRYNWG